MIQIFDTLAEYNIYTSNDENLSSGVLYYVKEDGSGHFFTNNIDGENKLYDMCGSEEYLIVKYNIDTEGDIYIGEITDDWGSKYCDEIIIDGVNQETFSNTYHLTVGEHIIKFKFNNGIISTQMFRNNAYIKEIYIPQNITTIGNGAFDGCSALRVVNFAKDINLTKFNNLIFNKCPIECITIPNKINQLGQSCLFQTSLTNIVIPDNVTIIDKNAFNTCRSLKTLIIGSGVTKINSQAFRNVDGLITFIVKPTTPPVLSYDVFSGDISNCPIYVPAASVDAYKAASGWSNYASRIQAIS